MLLRVVQQPRLPVMVVRAFVDPYRGMMPYSNVHSDEFEERRRSLHPQTSEQLEKLLADCQRLRGDQCYRLRLQH